MAGWPDGRVSGWPDGRMAGWPGGRVAGWPGGRVAGRIKSRLWNSLDAINEMSMISMPFASKESFPDAEDIDVPENLQRPFRLSFEKVKDEPGKRPIERALDACQVCSNSLRDPSRNANMCCTGSTDSTRKRTAPGLISFTPTYFKDMQC